MNYQRITQTFTLASKICAVMTAAAIVLSTAATVVLFPLTVLFSLAAGDLSKKFFLIIRNPAALMFLFFCFLLLFGTVYSTAPWIDIVRALRKYDKFLLAVMFFPLFTEEKWRNYAIYSFLGGILVMLLAAYLRLYGYRFLDSGMTGYSAIEVFKSSIEFNFLLAFASYLCLLKITSARCCRWLWIMFFLLIVYTLLFRSIGRSGYVVFAGIMLLFFIQKYRWRGFIAAAISAVLLFGLAFAFSTTFKERVNAVFSEVKTYEQDDYTSVGARMTFVKNSVKLIKRHPFFGTGTGSFTHEYAALEPTPEFLTRNPHNEYVHITVQFGFYGLVLLLLFFAVPLWYSKFLPENEKYIARGIIISIMLGSLANSWLLDITEGHCYAYFIALAFATLPPRDIRAYSFSRAVSRIYKKYIQDRGTQ